MNRYICEGIIRDISHGKRVAVLVPAFYNTLSTLASVVVHGEGHYDHLNVNTSDMRLIHDSGGDALFFPSFASISGYRNIDTLLVPRGTDFDGIPVAARMTAPIREFMEY